MTSYTGSCHCGAACFTVDTDPVELTRCDCSLCVKKNALMIKAPHAALTVTAGQDMLSTYQWNTGVARHHFCRACGIYTFHSKRSEPDHYGVNVFCLDGFDVDALPIRQADGKTMSVVETPK